MRQTEALPDNGGRHMPSSESLRRNVVAPKLDIPRQRPRRATHMPHTRREATKDRRLLSPEASRRPPHVTAPAVRLADDTSFVCLSPDAQ